MIRTTRTSLRLVSVAAAVALLAGCGSPQVDAPPVDGAPSPAGAADDADPGHSPDETESDPVEPTPATDTLDPFTEPDMTVTSTGSGDIVTVTNVRLGVHEVGFDRVVLDHSGGGTPGWRVQYTRDPRADGSGDPVDIAGDAVLAIVLDHTGYPFDTGADADDVPRSVTGSSVVAEVVHLGVFEGYTQVFIGLTSELPFRVFALDGRVVIDIAHE